MQRRLFAVLVVTAAAGALLVGGMLSGQSGAKQPAERDPISYRDLVKKVLPAVVNIETRVRKTKANVPSEPPLQDDFGSGFLATADGALVTCYHIVQDVEQVAVKLHDGRTFVTKDIRGDARSDLAVIRLDTRGEALPFLEFGDSEAMELGDRVLAIGAPFGLSGSVTHGIVSGKARDLNINLYEDFLQTDAAINPGNSGGPLVNLEGKVIGVCAAIKSRSGGFQGVGLAISSNLARGITEALRREGVVRRAFLGLQARDLAPDVAARLGVPKAAGGIVVAQVFADTPAAQAQLQPGDVLLEVAGQSVATAKVLQRVIARLPIGKTVALTFIRAGKTQTAEAPVTEQPANFPAPSVPAPRAQPFGVPAVPVPKLGLQLADLPVGLANDLGYPPGARGVLVTHVDATAPAFDAGLRRGMLITQIEGAAVGSAAAARERLAPLTTARPILLQVRSPEGGVTYLLVATR